MYRIGDWSFDPLAARLCRADEERRLDPKEVSVLAHLIEDAPNPVSIEALLDRSWPGVIVGDNAVHQVVGRLRKALGDKARHPIYIETLPRRGYRLLIEPGPVPHAPTTTSSPRRWWDRWQIWVALATASAGAAGISLWTVAPPLPNVVVQPFMVHSQEPDLLHLARGFEDEVIHAIARNPAVTVAGPAMGPDLQAAGLVVTGRLRPAESDRVRVSVFTETLDRTIWTRNFDVGRQRPLAEQVAVADEVSIAIAVISDLMRTLQRGTQNDRALVALLRGRLLSGSDTLEGATASIGYFDQAIRLDPDFAAPYAYKALSYRTLANWYAMETTEAVARMRQLVNGALARDPELPIALLVSTTIKLYDGAYVEAERDLQTAIAGTAPRSLSPRPLAAIVLAHCGRFDEALNLLEHGIESNPVHPQYLEHYQAQFLWYARRYEEALAVLDQVLTVNPMDKRAREIRGHVLISLERYEEGVAELAWQFPRQQGWMREAYATGGLRGIGEGYLDHAERIERRQVPFTPPASAWRMYARGHAMLGEYSEAVAWMEHGWSLGDRWEFFYNRVYPWPGFDELRAHPEFKSLMLRTVGEPPTCPGHQA